MKETLPIWFQAMSLILISCAYGMTHRWVWQQGEADPGSRLTLRMEDATKHILYVAMPVPIIYLGGRFVLRNMYVEHEMNMAEAVLCFFAAACLVPALLALGTMLFPAVQRVREASGSSVSLSRSMEGRIAAAK